jgi:hypothetical protein
VNWSNVVVRFAEFGLLGIALGSQKVVDVVPSGFGPLSACNPSRSLECARLPTNSRSGVRRGQTFVVLDRPVGCSGSAIQNPLPSEAAATLPRNRLFGFVIQNAAGASLSLGSSRSSGFGRSCARSGC